MLLSLKKKNSFTKKPEWLSKPRAFRTPHSPLHIRITNINIMSLVFPLYDVIFFFISLFSITLIETALFCVAWVFMFIQNSYFSKCFVPFSSKTCCRYRNNNVWAIVNIWFFYTGRFHYCLACILVFSTLSHDTNGNKYNRNWCQFSLNEQPTALL